MSKKALLVHRSKEILSSGLLRELVIWRFKKSAAYPLGIKYRMALIDPVRKKVIILYDNHSPKGPHWHDNTGQEFAYSFVSLDKLMSDFLEIVRKQEFISEDNEN